MLLIDKPIVRKENTSILLSTHLQVDGGNEWINKISDFPNGGELYFSTTEEWGNYLTTESSDCFVVAVLVYAIKHGHDIKCDTISEKLYYNLVRKAIPVIASIHGAKEIKILYGHLTNENYQPTGVGTGCSLGIDSFSTIIDHLSDECPASFKLTHFTYFNVGANGDIDLNKVKKSYEKDYQLVLEYARSKNIPVVKIESNISQVYLGEPANENYMSRNIATVLSMQKLFGKYIYASNYTLKDAKFTKQTMHAQESWLLPAWSTESTELILGDPCMVRTEKTKRVIQCPDTYKHLYVCWKEVFTNYGVDKDVTKVKDDFRNCTRCGKCLRTLLTFDILGVIERYKDIFDLDYYYSNHDVFVSRVIAQRKKNLYYDDIYNLMKACNYNITPRARMFTFMWHLYDGLGLGKFSKILKKLVLKK